MRNVMASATEAELGGFFENCQRVKSIRTALAEMGHPQPPTLVATYNTVTNRIVNGLAKLKRPIAIDMRFYSGRDIIQQNHLHIFWDEGKNNLAGCITKHHPIWHHRTMRPIYCKAKKKTSQIKRPSNWDRKRVFWNYQSQGNPETGYSLKGIHNPSPRKPDNPLKEIQNLVPNRIRIQCQRGLTVPT